MRGTATDTTSRDRHATPPEPIHRCRRPGAAPPDPPGHSSGGAGLRLAGFPSTELNAISQLTGSTFGEHVIVPIRRVLTVHPGIFIPGDALDPEMQARDFVDGPFGNPVMGKQPPMGSVGKIPLSAPESSRRNSPKKTQQARP